MAESWFRDDQITVFRTSWKIWRRKTASNWRHRLANLVGIGHVGIGREFFERQIGGVNMRL